MATTFPTIIVKAEITARTGVRLPANDGNANAKTRNNAAKPAILAPAAMNAVTEEGAP